MFSKSAPGCEVWSVVPWVLIFALYSILYPVAIQCKNAFTFMKGQLEDHFILIRNVFTI